MNDTSRQILNLFDDGDTTLRLFI